MSEEIHSSPSSALRRRRLAVAALLFGACALTATLYLTGKPEQPVSLFSSLQADLEHLEIEKEYINFIAKY
jgi:hypothetical protein